MAIVRPLVINTATGQIERAAATDSVLSPDQILVSNETGSPLVIGTPVYQTAVASEVAKADADAALTANVIGLIQEVSIADGATGYALTDGLLTATTGQWDAVTGQVGGLTAGAAYFLSAGTPGMLTTTPPVADGHFIAPIGTAKSTTEFEITIRSTIKL